MIIALTAIAFAAILFALVYFPYRREINDWFRRKKFKESRNLIAAAAVVAIIVAAVLGFSFSQQPASRDDLNAEALSQLPGYSLDIGSELPELVLPDTEGQKVDLSSFDDQTLVLAFWNTWCKYCAKQLPELQELVKQSSGRAQVFLINMNESQETVKKYKADQKIDFPILVDAAGEVSRLFKIQGTPTNFFVKHGIICAQVPGAMGEEAILASLEDCATVSAPVDSEDN